MERYVEEFLELSKRVSWHDAALGACFQLGLDDEMIRCDLPWGDFPLIERINLILFLNGSDFEVEEIPKSRHPAQAGTRRMSPAHPMPNPPPPPPPFLRSSSILLSPEPPSMAKSRQLAAADSSPLAAADSSTPAPAPPLRPPVHAPPECPPVPFLQCDCWIEPVYSPRPWRRSSHGLLSPRIRHGRPSTLIHLGAPIPLIQHGAPSPWTRHGRPSSLEASRVSILDQPSGRPPPWICYGMGRGYREDDVRVVDSLSLVLPLSLLIFLLWLFPVPVMLNYYPST